VKATYTFKGVFRQLTKLEVANVDNCGRCKSTIPATDAQVTLYPKLQYLILSSEG